VKRGDAKAIAGFLRPAAIGIEHIDAAVGFGARADYQEAIGACAGATVAHLAGEDRTPCRRNPDFGAFNDQKVIPGGLIFAKWYSHSSLIKEVPPSWAIENPPIGRVL
jgi:hypothetical protein